MSATATVEIAARGGAVARGEIRAEELIESTLARIARSDPHLNSFTAVFADAARAQARRIDSDVRAGKSVGPLAGVPFGVKNLFDVEGTVTLAGSRIRCDAPAAARDATIVRRLRAAGAILVGTLNMDEFAYGFSTENAHYGATRNPHDGDRMAGGSSGGAAAAVAADLLPLTLGTDTNGSIRIPAAFCGVWGLKPTYGRLSRAGAFPFVASFDHVGHFARCVRDLAYAYDLMQGPDAADPVCAGRPIEPAFPDLDAPTDTLRVGVLDGWFQESASADVREALDLTVQALPNARKVQFPEVERARAAAVCITAAEGGRLHLADLTARPHDFDIATRDRLIAGALLPAAVVLQAQAFRRWFRAQVARVFADFDVLLAPVAPCSAPRFDDTLMTYRGRSVPIRATLGIYTQPLSFIGLPVVSAPVNRPGLPTGIQIIAKPWAEAIALRLARRLERDGVLAAQIAAPP